MLAPPVSDSRMCSASSCASNGSEISGRVTATRLWPSNSEVSPIRWYADSALGLAKTTTPSTSRRMKPSPTRGLDRDIARSPILGNVPSVSMCCRLAAQSR